MGLFENLKKIVFSEKNLRSASESSLAAFLSEKRILFFNAGPSKQQVFGSLIAALDLPDPSAALKAILSREEAGSTIISDGVAFPHARISGITKIEATLGIYPAGLEDRSGKTAPIKIILLFLGPADTMRQHLAFLANAAAFFQKDKIVSTIIQQTTSKAVLKKIQELEETN